MSQHSSFKNTGFSARRSFHPYRNSILGGGALCLLCTCILATTTHISFVGAYILAINLTTFCLMGYDKQGAVRGDNRIPEIVIGLWALVGGSLGSLLGMKFFRHKTQKARFHLLIALVLIIQLIALQYFGGFSLLHSLG